MLDMTKWRERLRAGLGPRALLSRVPTDCPLCGVRAHGGWPCPPCRSALALGGDGRRCAVCAHRLEGAVCGDCARHWPAFDRVVAAFDYEGPGRDLMLLFKARRRFHLSTMLAGLLAQAIDGAGVPLPRSTILVPVPARRAAMMRRGFNPAAEVARALSARMGLRCAPEMLWRVDGGAKQALLGRAARLVALRGVYHCGRVPVGCHVAVIDDVLTTGSTLDAIALELKAAGASTVTGLVLARAVAGAAPFSE